MLMFAEFERSHSAVGCAGLLRQYVQLLAAHVTEALAAAAALAAHNAAMLPLLHAVLNTDVTGR